MRTYLSAGLVCLTLLFGCGGANEGEIERSTVASDATAVTENVSELTDELMAYGSQAAAQLGLGESFTDDFDGLAERRVIRVLVPYSRTYYFIERAKQQGITYEALKLFEKEINEKLGTGHVKVHVVPIPTSRDRLLPDLVDGRGDLAAAGLTITPERLKLVDFSDPFARRVREIVVTTSDEPPLASVDDLAGRSVYVRTSSSYYESLLELNERFERDGLAPMTIEEAEEALEDEDLLEMLNAGLLETVIVDDHKAELWSELFENIALHPEAAVRTGGEVAWAFRKDSPRLAEVVNRFVAGHKQGTLMGNILIKRYWKDTKWVSSALAEDERERYDATVGIFREYANRYDFDHLMMVAQGYQESGLDQGVVSPVGAIGIMQLLPSTASDSSVGIPDISTPENNIHAGVKYMRWILDTYFDDPAMDERNRVLLAFASYNAGANRIRRLRRKAEERGLDPNRWFGNVELIAAEEIGRETVQYVGNIYKYYAAYRLVEEQRARRTGARQAVS